MGEAGTPLAETEAGTHSQVQAFQTALSGAQIRQPMDDSILSSKTRQRDVLGKLPPKNRIFGEFFSQREGGGGVGEFCPISKTFALKKNSR